MLNIGGNHFTSPSGVWNVESPPYGKKRILLNAMTIYRDYNHSYKLISLVERIQEILKSLDIRAKNNESLDLVIEGRTFQCKAEDIAKFVKVLMNNAYLVFLQIIDPQERKTELSRAACIGNTSHIDYLIANGVDPNTKNKEWETPLCLAIVKNGFEIVQHLVSNGADVNFSGIKSPLSTAVIANRKDVVELLLEKGANINETNINGDSPLNYAIYEGHKEMVEFLIARGAAVNQETRPPLSTAVLMKNLGLVKLLVEKGANVNDGALSQATNPKTKEIFDFLLQAGANVNKGTSPLFSLVSSYYYNKHIFTAECIPAFLEPLLSRGLSIESKNKYGNTILIEAAAELVFVEALLKVGANVNVIGADNENALIKTIKKCKVEEDCYKITKMLIEKNIDLEQRHYKNQTALHSSMHFFSVFKLLVESGACVNATDNDGKTPLQMAADYYQPDRARLLYKYGANLEAVDKNGCTALHKSSRETANFLLESGANLHAVDHAGRTVLHARSAPITKFFIERGANINAVDNNGNTALHLAVLFENFGVIEILAHHGANLNLKNNEGETPLFTALRNRNTKLTELLLQNGADPNVVNNKGKSPLIIAISNEWVDGAKMLLNSEIPTDLTLTDNEGRSALHHAVVKFGGTIIAKELILLGVELECKDNQGSTPLHLSVLNPQMQLLLDNGANPEALDRNNQTPLDICNHADRELLINAIERKANLLSFEIFDNII